MSVQIYAKGIRDFLMDPSGNVKFTPVAAAESCPTVS